MKTGIRLNPGSKIFIIAALALIISPITAFAQTSKTEAFFKIFASGTYHMKARMSGGDGMTADMESYVRGGNMASTISAQGQTTRMIFKDNKMHMIMDSMKMIMITPMMDKSQAGGIETANMKPTGSGTARFAGKSLPYEEYSDPQGNKTQYFLDGDKLVGIRSIIGREGTVDIEILTLDQNVPNNVFDIPSGYQVQDMSGFGL